MEKNESLIPKGPYCYTYDENGNFKPCPYWDTVGGAPDQYNGYCHFLEKGDLDLEKEMEYTDMDTGKKTMGNDLPFPVSLLFDQCKECHINDDVDEEDWEPTVSDDFTIGPNGAYENNENQNLDVNNIDEDGIGGDATKEKYELLTKFIKKDKKKDE